MTDLYGNITNFLWVVLTLLVLGSVYLIIEGVKVHNLFAEFTALENICMPAFIKGEKPEIIKQRGEYLLELMGLIGKGYSLPSQMSGGEQQRVAVARAIINQPEIIFADEPSGNLDTKNANELHELFFKLKNEFNQTFVIVTHNEGLAKMADRTILMKDGLIQE